MARLKRVSKEKFAEHLMQSSSIQKAANEIWPTGERTQATKLARDPEVLEHIQTISATVERTHPDSHTIASVADIQRWWTQIIIEGSIPRYDEKGHRTLEYVGIKERITAARDLVKSKGGMIETIQFTKPIEDMTLDEKRFELERLKRLTTPAVN
jgi:hypothetical protein